MHKPINQHALAVTAVAIYDGLMRGGMDPVWAACNKFEIAGTELYSLCAELAEVSEKMLIDLTAENKPPFDFPGVYDYEVGEELGEHLRHLMVVRKRNPAQEQQHLKTLLGALAFRFFSHSPSFKDNRRNIDIIAVHTGFISLED